MENPGKPIKLAILIQREIRNRILICFCFLFLVFISITAFDISKTSRQIRLKAERTCGALEDFTIGQLLIGNDPAIAVKLREFNSSPNALHVEWKMDHDVPPQKGITWQPPFGWKYVYPLRRMGGQSFGSFLIYGNFLEETAALNELAVRLAFLTLFALLTTVVLYPISSRIPKQLIFDPVSKVLGLLGSTPHPATLEGGNRPLEIVEIAEIERNVRHLLELAARSARSTTFATFSQQVAHDIRSPLAALEMVTQMTDSLPEDTRLIIRSAVGRIRDIANSLLLKNQEQTLANHPGATKLPAHDEPKSLQLLSSVMDVLVTEKRMQYRSKLGVEIECNLDRASYGLFSTLQLGEFKRVLSNLINNAVEGLGTVEQGRVSILLTPGRHAQEILLCIQDSGKGIPPELVARLGQRGETHGKVGGSGLGLYHARTSVESWGGTLAIESQVDVGTRILITLPRSPAPDWFVPVLRVSPKETVVILDDDTSIHQIWRERFDPYPSVQLVHCSTPDELIAWHTQHAMHGHPTDAANSVTYLCDYELIGHEKSGLDTIEHLGISNRSILVTSRFEETKIRERCEQMGVKLIPKGMAAFVSIETLSSLDAVLIDDDELVHMSWKVSAKKLNKTLRTFYTSEEFLAEANQFDRTNPIYIDSNLKDGVKGEEVAKTIHGLRFDSIYLATGYDASSFDPLSPHILGILGKEPPWRAG
jgi:signal transduction histidine kinase